MSPWSRFPFKIGVGPRFTGRFPLPARLVQFYLERRFGAPMLKAQAATPVGTKMPRAKDFFVTIAQKKFTGRAATDADAPFAVGTPAAAPQRGGYPELSLGVGRIMLGSHCVATGYPCSTGAVRRESEIPAGGRQLS